MHCYKYSITKQLKTDLTMRCQLLLERHWSSESYQIILWMLDFIGNQPCSPSSCTLFQRHLPASPVRTLLLIRISDCLWFDREQHHRWNSCNIGIAPEPIDRGKSSYNKAQNNCSQGFRSPWRNTPIPGAIRTGWNMTGRVSLLPWNRSEKILKPYLPGRLSPLPSNLQQA